MESFKAILEEYGADYDGIMERFSESADTYLRILRMLAYDTNIEKLGAAVEHGSLKDGFFASHALKGVSANLGLIPFYNAICSINDPLRAGDLNADYKALYRSVCREYDRAMEMTSALINQFAKL